MFILSVCKCPNNCDNIRLCGKLTNMYTKTSEVGKSNMDNDLWS